VSHLDLSLVIPLFNEEESLAELHAWIDRVCTAQGLRYEVIFINDGSTDGSWKVIEGLSAQHSEVRGIRFRRNHGKSAALYVGFQAAQGDVVITMDADFSHDPAIIPTFLELLNSGCDVVIGSRYCPGGSIINWPWYRTALSKWGNLYTRALLRVSTTDCTTGYRGYTTQALDKIEIENVPGEGYVFL
jgi:glycosyltransferase involved in cell wall biosynthesis